MRAAKAIHACQWVARLAEAAVRFASSSCKISAMRAPLLLALVFMMGLPNDKNAPSMSFGRALVC
jgi:hypothetical protein